MEFTVLDNRVKFPLTLLGLFTLHVNLVRGLTARRTIANKDRLLFRFPAAAASSFAKNTGATERIGVELAVGLLNEAEI